jgi:hypothetical protein
MRYFNPDSKYAYCPQKLDGDIRNKQEVNAKMEAEIKEILFNKVKNRPRYSDGKKMCVSNSMEAIRRAVTALFEEYDY